MKKAILLQRAGFLALLGFVALVLGNLWGSRSGTGIRGDKNDPGSSVTSKKDATLDGGWGESGPLSGQMVVSALASETTEGSRLYRYRCKMADRTWTLRLWTSGDFMSPTLVVRDVGAEEAIRPNHHAHCFMRGVVEGVRSSSVSLNACDGLSGVVKTKDWLLLIEPAPSDLRGRTSATSCSDSRCEFRLSDHASHVGIHYAPLGDDDGDASVGVQMEQTVFGPADGEVLHVFQRTRVSPTEFDVSFSLPKVSVLPKEFQHCDTEGPTLLDFSATAPSWSGL